MFEQVCIRQRRAGVRLASRRRRPLLAPPRVQSPAPSFGRAAGVPSREVYPTGAIPRDSLSGSVSLRLSRIPPYTQWAAISTCEGRVSASVLKTSAKPKSPQFEKNARQMADLLTMIKNEEETIREGGGAKAIEAQHKKNRLTARERIAALI